MNAHSPTPSAAFGDASNRAWRTLAQGLLVDLVAAVTVAVAAATAGGIEWTQAYWLGLSLAVGKSVIMATLAYVARLALPPAAPTTRGGDDS